MKNFNTPVEELITSMSNRRLALVVGSGISRYSDSRDDRLSWRGLISHGIEFCKNNLSSRQLESHRNTFELFQKSGGALSTADLIQSAQAIEDMLGAPKSGDFKRWLNIAFSDTTPKIDLLLKIIKDIPALRLTLNYDTFLEKIFRKRSISWTNKAELLDWMRTASTDTASADILHIHGVWTIPESVVFGKKSYIRVKQHHTIQQALKNVFTSNTVLFIGCGQTFDDPNIGNFLEWMGKFLYESQYHHFKLDIGEINKILDYEKDKSLYSIGYGSNYDDLPRYIEYLLNEAKVSKRKRNDSLSIKSYQCEGSFVGRLNEFKRLRAVLLKKKSVAVPIIGPPGVGKTRFVTHVLESTQIRRRYVTIIRIHCDGIASIDSLFLRLARELGQSSYISKTMLINYLSKMPTVLLFDNAESFTESIQVELCNFLRELLDQENISVIVTYRGRYFPSLFLSWEKTIELNPLDSIESQKLFLRLAGDKFTNDKSLPDLLKLSGGLPIVIRSLASTANKFKNLSELIEEYKAQPNPFIFHEQSEKYSLGSAANSFRLALSNPALSKADKELLSVLSYYPQGLSTKAINGILGKAGTKSLRELRGAWLLEDISETDKVTILPPLRDYLKEKHVSPPDLMAIFADYFAEYCIQKASYIGQHGGAEAAAELTSVLDEIEVSIRNLCIRYEKKAITVSTKLANYMDFTGFGSISLLTEVVNYFSEDQEIALLLERIGDVYLFRNNLTNARRFFLKALELFDHANQWSGKAKCFKRLADIDRALGNLTESLCFYNNSIELYREINDLGLYETSRGGPKMLGYSNGSRIVES